MGRADRLFTRGTEHLERWHATHHVDDLNASIAAFTKLDSILPAGDGRRAVVDWQLGNALACRAEQEQSIAALDDAIARLRRAAAAPEAAGNEDFDGCHLILGKAIASRLDFSGPGKPTDAELFDLVKTATDSLAVAARSQSEYVPPAERAQAATIRGHLMPNLVIAWAAAVRSADGAVDRAKLERRASDGPDDHPARPRLFLTLGCAYMCEFLSDTMSSPSWEPAIRYLSAAMDSYGQAEPLIPIALAYVVIFRAAALTAKAGDILDHRTRDLVTRLLAHPGLNAEAAASLHVVMARHVASGRAANLTAAMEHLNQAQRLAPQFEPVQSGVLAVFSEVLTNQTQMSGSLDDSEAAAAAYQRVVRTLEEQRKRADRGQPTPWYERGAAPRAQLAALLTHPAVRQAERAGDEISEALREGDLARMDVALEGLDRLLAHLPAEHEARWIVQHSIGEGWRLRGLLSGDQEDLIRGLRTKLGSLELAAADPASRLFVVKGRVGRMKAYLALALAMVARDAEALSAALRQMPALGDDPSLTPPERADWAWQYGAALAARHEIAGQPDDLDDGIARLEQAARLAAELDVSTMDHGPAQYLAAAYWRRADRSRRDQQRAIDTGMLALRQRATAVLLQSSAAQGLRLTSRYALTQVDQLVNWCLAEGQASQAIEALELGRAVVLHAATVAADIPALLTTAGEAALAAEWRTAAARSGPAPENALSRLLDAPGMPGPVEPPSALRRQVIGALRATEAGEPLLASPDLITLTSALRGAKVDAFVYLIPPCPGYDGRALLLSPRGGLEQLTLPGLSEADPLDSYGAASLAAAANGWAEPRGWTDALGAVCDWAWTAAVGPLLDHVGRWPLTRPPRLVVIPVGRLTLVPWHAARTVGPDGAARRAVQDAVFSYAASAGQFARAACRPRPLASATPVLVANPTADLRLAESEVAELKRRYYPDAAYLGRPARLASGPATPEEVLSWLPGGTRPLTALLHCGCHANVAASLAESYLELDDGQRLRVGTILGQAQRHDPSSPGFLAVLSACMTDLANMDHDEALTLASALLAAGASGVVGARWPVPDGPTAVLMVMFHHFLNNGHPHPADALRQAQLWMLDDNRPLLSDLPRELREAAGLPLADPYFWAAFTYQGAHVRP